MVDDQHGIDKVKLTIHGGEYGNRTYEWNLPNLPGGWIWDRYFGEIVAPVGDYPVTIEASDGFGNVSTEHGTIIIPPPDAPDEGALAVLAPTAEAGSGSGLLWGAAALAAIAGATAYGLSRKNKREAEIEAKRKEIAERRSDAAFADHLRSLRAAAAARIAPVRKALLAAGAAAAKAADELERRRKIQAALGRNEALLGGHPIPREQQVAWQMPDPELRDVQTIGRIYSSSSIVQEIQAAQVTGIPPPPRATAIPTGTPTPPGWSDQPTPAPVPTAPLPPGYVPNDPDLFGIEGKWIGRAFRLARSVGKASAASAIEYTLVEPGRYIVSAPAEAAGSRATLLSRYFLRGGAYTETTLSRVGLRQITPRGFAVGAKGTVGVGLLTSIASNLWEYGVGGHSDKGIISQEFAVSTGVDFVLTIGTGLVAAGTVAGVVALVGFTAPVWATVGAAAGLGLLIGIGLDALVAGSAIKDGVNSGIKAWPGIIQNAGTIAQVVGSTATEAVANVVDQASAYANQAISDISSSAREIASSAQDVTSAVVETAQNAVDSARSFIGNLFGGGD